MRLIDLITPHTAFCIMRARQLLFESAYRFLSLTCNIDVNIYRDSKKRLSLVD